MSAASRVILRVGGRAARLRASTPRGAGARASRAAAAELVRAVREMVKRGACPPLRASLALSLRSVPASRVMVNLGLASVRYQLLFNHPRWHSTELGQRARDNGQWCGGYEPGSSPALEAEMLNERKEAAMPSLATLRSLAMGREDRRADWRCHLYIAAV
jgi:hypothetical protein